MTHLRAGGRFVFTSESVTEGHPDKLADQISDAILDAYLEQDPAARVAVEVLLTRGLALVAGEVTTSAVIDLRRLVRRTITDVGYTRAELGFDAERCALLTSIDEQSPDIARGVDTALEAREAGAGDADTIGAGDQGMVFGFACDETPEFMPMPIVLAHRLARRLAEVRHRKILPYLRPDGKTQVTVEYAGGRPVRVDTVLISAQHEPDVSLETLQDDLYKRVVRQVIPPELLGGNLCYLVNPTGRFVLGGPQADTGLTGRKIIVDTYGSYARHGGGSFSGKDPTKVDRSGAYALRYVAKNLVAAGLARVCEVQVAYAIGMARPVSLLVDTFGTGVAPDAELTQLVRRCFDLRPASIIRDLDLRRPIYRQTAVYGHFGRSDLDLPWERTDRVGELRREAGLTSAEQVAVSRASPAGGNGE